MLWNHYGSCGPRAGIATSRLRCSVREACLRRVKEGFKKESSDQLSDHGSPATDVRFTDYHLNETIKGIPAKHVRCVRPSEPEKFPPLGFSGTIHRHHSRHSGQLDHCLTIHNADIWARFIKNPHVGNNDREPEEQVL